MEQKALGKMTKQDPKLLLEIKAKAFKVWATEPKLKLSQLKKIKCPVLVLAGDDEPFTSKMTFEISIYPSALSAIGRAWKP